MPFECNQSRTERISFRMLPFDLRSDDLELGLGALYRCAWVQPADYAQRIAPAVGLLSQWKREEQIETAARIEHSAEVKRLRQDARYRNRRVIQNQLPASDIRIGSKVPLPQAVAQHRRSWTVPLAFVVCKLPADV